MSKEDAKAFHEKAKTDPSIQKELHDRTRHPVDIGRDLGLNFTKEEHDEVMREKDKPGSAAEGSWSTNM